MGVRQVYGSLNQEKWVSVALFIGKEGILLGRS